MSRSRLAPVATRTVGVVAGVVGVLVPVAGAVIARRAAALYETPDVVPAPGLEPVSVGGLPGWICPGGDGTTWAVFLPGLGSHPLRHQDVADAFIARGDTVLFASHSARHPAHRHGFGLREQDEALAWLRFAAARGATEVVLLGWSFGASLWLRLLAGPLPVRVRSVVLTGPLSDWDATVAHGAGGGLIGRAVAAVMRWTLRVPGLARLAGQDRPVRLGLPEVAGPAPSLLVVHGDADRTVPLDSSRALVASWPGTARLHVVAGATHGGERDTNPTGWLDAVALAV
jgi:pimeloyl-ACP methyl ester carboxylesterase